MSMRRFLRPNGEKPAENRRGAAHNHAAEKKRRTKGCGRRLVRHPLLRRLRWTDQFNASFMLPERYPRKSRLT